MKGSTVIIFIIASLMIIWVTNKSIAVNPISWMWPGNWFGGGAE